MKQESYIETIYDTHSALLYGIALEISPTQSGAEEILTKAFQKIATLKLVESNNRPIPCITLIKMTIEAAYELHGSFSNDIKLKQFESTPILNKLLCKQMSLDNYCEANGIDRAKAVKILRAEFASIRQLEVKEPYTDKSKYG